MSSTEEIRSTLDRLPAGLQVRLELADGRTIEGKIRSIEDDVVKMRNAEQVATSEVADVVVIRHTDGPE